MAYVAMFAILVAIVFVVRRSWYKDEVKWDTSRLERCERRLRELEGWKACFEVCETKAQMLEVLASAIQHWKDDELKLQLSLAEQKHKMNWPLASRKAFTAKAGANA